MGETTVHKLSNCLHMRRIEDQVTDLLTNLKHTDLLTIKDLKKFASAESDTGSIYYLAMSYGSEWTCTGIICLTIRDSLLSKGTVGHIDDLVVRPTSRKQGIGRKLVEECLQRADTAGCYKVILQCKEGLENYYANNGFHSDGINMRMNYGTK